MPVLGRSSSEFLDLSGIDSTRSYMDKVVSSVAQEEIRQGSIPIPWLNSKGGGYKEFLQRFGLPFDLLPNNSGVMRSVR